ncbi:MAG TPA: hypothetical protein VFX74_06800 [Candidatus Limnocylindria bacterium]|nr:hypothetical protein [Candidatus Limnocylindria bacterium]
MSTSPADGAPSLPAEDARLVRVLQDAQDMRATRLDLIDQLLAVIDDPQVARAAVGRLGEAGFGTDAVVLLEGDDGIARLDAHGVRGGWWMRAVRIVGLLAADQSVDLATYEAALKDGRAVIAVRVHGSASRRRVARLLAGDGGHFINFFGRLSTEDLVPWRGAQLEIPFQFHR